MNTPETGCFFLKTFIHQKKHIDFTEKNVVKKENNDKTKTLHMDKTTFCPAGGFIYSFFAKSMIDSILSSK